VIDPDDEPDAVGLDDGAPDGLDDAVLPGLVAVVLPGLVAVAAASELALELQPASAHVTRPAAIAVKRRNSPSRSLKSTDLNSTVSIALVVSISNGETTKS
jgi:hypothetical protein